MRNKKKRSYKIQKILSDFADMVLDKLQQELPTIKDIQYANNLVLGAFLLNLLAYKANP